MHLNARTSHMHNVHARAKPQAMTAHPLAPQEPCSSFSQKVPPPLLALANALTSPPEGNREKGTALGRKGTGFRSWKYRLSGHFRVWGGNLVRGEGS